MPTEKVVIVDRIGVEYKPEGPQNTNAAVTTAAVTPAAIKIFSPSIFF